MLQNIFIIGVGNVGKELINQICSSDVRELKRHNNPTNIVGIADSKRYYFNYSGITTHLGVDDFDDPNCVSTRIEDLLQNGFYYSDLEYLLKVVHDNGLDADMIFIDATDDKYMLKNFHVNVINNTQNKIVTCNKNPLSLSSFDEFILLTKDRHRYGFRSTVMAGAHSVEQLREFYDTCENILKIEGCLSGTLGYISSKLEEGLKFSAIIKSAYENGYTEPNPIDDLNGIDVARKLLILARSINLDLSLEDIQITPVIDIAGYSNYTLEQFFLHIQKEDERFQYLVASAYENNKVLRYVASLELHENKPKLKVGFEVVNRDSPLGMLKGTANKIVIRTNHFTADNEYIIQAPGAGAAVTASGIRRDLLQMLPNRAYNPYLST